MAATSMMKEYVKRQLKYWLENFKDDQLPRDFNSKGFARPAITLHKITLKPDKIAALLHVPAPLIVTRATCSELTIKVPSWQLAEKFVQEPLSLKLGDLFVDIKHIDECDEHVGRDSVARARAASMEPDPLGSIASMYQFATVISERLELQIDNVYLKLYEKQALRVRVEMNHFHARTTNALWQDMRDLTDCVDRSPDGLLKTRFKFVSAQCSVYLHQDSRATSEKVGADASSAQTPPPLRLLRDHAIAMRVTLFGHRTSKQDAWAVLSRVVDVNLETLPFEMDTTQLRDVYDLYVTLARWMHEAAAGTARDKGDDGMLLPHQIVRGPLTPTRKASADDRPAEEAHRGDDADAGGNTFALQITVRFTAHMLLRVRSAHRGDVQLAVIAQHAALNWIQHDDVDAATEMQLTVHDLSVRHKDKVLFHVKPAREVLQVKRLPVNDGGSNHGSLFVKWHVQKLTCHLEKEIAMLVNELFHSFNEIEQAATITCGTCHHKIRLDAIEHHMCSGTTAPGSPRNGTANDSSRHSSDGVNVSTVPVLLIDSTQLPKLRLVLALDELELVTDSFLFRSVQDLARLATEPEATNTPMPMPARRFVVTVRDWSVSTESKEFVGDAIFVPVLPLAFQMLECTIRGCGCVHRQQQQQKQRKQTQKQREQRRSSESVTVDDPMHDHDDGHDHDHDDHDDPSGVECNRRRQARPRWPDRVFAELGHFSLRASNANTQTETFLMADNASLRLSFSDGVLVCPQSTPQMSCYFHVERIRCQIEHAVYQRVQAMLTALQDPLAGHTLTALTLFFAVLEVRNVELTLLDDPAAATLTTATRRPTAARLKAQFRHVGGVADNHHGRLALQTNVDFRALLQSDAVQFAFPIPNPESSATARTGHVTKRERRRLREQATQVHAAQQIQRVFRTFADVRRHRLDQELRRLTRDDEDGDAGREREEDVDDTAVSRSKYPLPGGDRTHESSSTPSDGTSSPRRKSGGKSTARFGSTAEDLASISPKKMVAAAGVLKDGVLGFVKAKQQLLETEMNDFALQSKESASRFMPKYSAVKNLLSPKTASGSAATASLSSTTTVATAVEPVTKATEVRDAEAEAGDDDGDHDHDQDQDQEPLRHPDGEDNGQDDGRPSIGELEVSRLRDEGSEVDEGSGQDSSDHDEGHDDQDDPVSDQGEEETMSSPLDAAPAEPQADDDKDTAPAPSPVSAADALLASLPPIVRLLVQVEEHRLCVPIDPRVPVAVLCREIVRRFNEMFAQHGVITHVTLQNPQGGVFAGSDVVGLACDTAAAVSQQLVFFAYPHDHDVAAKSVVHVDLSNHDADSPSKPIGGTGGTKAASFQTRKVHSKFARCSKLPLPLAVALLANESERDLLRHVLADGSGGSNTASDDWPELALNVSFLDPTRDMLQVEVRWPSASTEATTATTRRCVEVTNRDAFLLCLQQIGLCTSRENSKHVGKVLRDRLRMDTKNPLVYAAVCTSPEFQDAFQEEARGESDAAAIIKDSASYESLKQIVQEDFGVYTRMQE